MGRRRNTIFVPTRNPRFRFHPGLQIAAFSVLGLVFLFRMWHENYMFFPGNILKDRLDPNLSFPVTQNESKHDSLISVQTPPFNVQPHSIPYTKIDQFRRSRDSELLRSKIPKLPPGSVFINDTDTFSPPVSTEISKNIASSSFSSSSSLSSSSSSSESSKLLNQNKTSFTLPNSTFQSILSYLSRALLLNKENTISLPSQPPPKPSSVIPKKKSNTHSPPPPPDEEEDHDDYGNIMMKKGELQSMIAKRWRFGTLITMELEQLKNMSLSVPRNIKPKMAMLLSSLSKFVAERKVHPTKPFLTLLTQALSNGQKKFDELQLEIKNRQKIKVKKESESAKKGGISNREQMDEGSEEEGDGEGAKLAEEGENKVNGIANKLKVEKDETNVGEVKIQGDDEKGERKLEIEGDEISPLLFIGIFSSPKHVKRRRVIRKTWLQYPATLTGIVTYRFFVGMHRNSSVNTALFNESVIENDVELLPMMDSYYVISLKTLAICRYGALRSNAKFVMKTDDDSFLRVDVLVKTLRKYENSGKSLFYGSLVHRNMPSRTVLSKWFVSFNEWPYKFYPIWAHGVGYIVSVDIAKYISYLYETGQLQIFKLEDVGISIWIDQYMISGHSIQFVNSPHIVFDGCRNNFIISHYQSIPGMQCLWDKLRLLKRAECCNNADLEQWIEKQNKDQMNRELILRSMATKH